METKLSEGQMSDEEITEISNLTGVSESSLRSYLKQGRTRKVLEIISNIPGTPSGIRRSTSEMYGRRQK